MRPDSGRPDSAELAAAMAAAKKEVREKAAEQQHTVALLLSQLHALAERSNLPARRMAALFGRGAVPAATEARTNVGKVKVEREATSCRSRTGPHRCAQKARKTTGLLGLPA